MKRDKDMKRRIDPHAPTAELIRHPDGMYEVRFTAPRITRAAALAFVRELENDYRDNPDVEIRAELRDLV